MTSVSKHEARAFQTVLAEPAVRLLPPGGGTGTREMKSLVYFTILLLIIPVQASLLAPLSLGGIKPDLALVAALYHRAADRPRGGSPCGHGYRAGTGYRFSKLHRFFRLDPGTDRFFRGIARQKSARSYQPVEQHLPGGFQLAGRDRHRVLSADVLRIGPVPQPDSRSHPAQALYTGLLGAVLLKLIVRKDVMSVLVRRDVQKEL